MTIPRMQRLILFSCLAAFCFLIVAPSAFVQDQPALPGYYDRLLDSTFYDVNRVVELGMDFALTYKDKIEKEFLEWVTGRDMKSPEDEDYRGAGERHATAIPHPVTQLMPYRKSLA